MLCSDCVEECVDCPSASQPAVVACPRCDESGCEQCQDEEQPGYFRVTSCPKQMLGPTIEELVWDLSPLFDEGAMPITGGVLDQAAWFIKAHRFLKNEKIRIENERNAQ